MIEVWFNYLQAKEKKEKELLQVPVWQKEPQWITCDVRQFDMSKLGKYDSFLNILKF